MSVLEYMLKEKNINENIRLYLAPIKVTNSNVLSKYVFDDKEFYDSNVRFWEMLLKNKYYSFIENEIPQMKYISCGALSRNNYIIDSSGCLYKCERTLGEQKYSVGNVEEGLFYNAQSFVFGEYKISAKCKKCSIYPVCRGGCRKDCIDGRFVDCESKIKEIKTLLKYKYRLISGGFS